MLSSSVDVELIIRPHPVTRYVSIYLLHQLSQVRPVRSDSFDDDGGVEEVSKKKKTKSRNDNLEDNR